MLNADSSFPLVAQLEFKEGGRMSIYSPSTHLPVFVSEKPTTRIRLCATQPAGYTSSDSFVDMEAFGDFKFKIRNYVDINRPMFDPFGTVMPFKCGSVNISNYKDNWIKIGTDVDSNLLPWGANPAMQVGVFNARMNMLVQRSTPQGPPCITSVEYNALREVVSSIMAQGSHVVSVHTQLIDQQAIAPHELMGKILSLLTFDNVLELFMPIHVGWDTNAVTAHFARFVLNGLAIEEEEAPESILPPPVPRTDLVIVIDYACPGMAISELSDMLDVFSDAKKSDQTFMEMANINRVVVLNVPRSHAKYSVVIDELTEEVDFKVGECMYIGVDPADGVYSVKGEHFMSKVEELFNNLCDKASIEPATYASAVKGSVSPPSSPRRVPSEGGVIDEDAPAFVPNKKSAVKIGKGLEDLFERAEHEAGLEYGANGPDIAADNMAAHLAASSDDVTNVVAITLLDEAGKLLIGKEDDLWTLPFGEIKPNEDTSSFRCAERVLEEKTGFVISPESFNCMVLPNGEPAIFLYVNEEGIKYRMHMMMTSVEMSKSAADPTAPTITGQWETGRVFPGRLTNICFTKPTEATEMAPARQCVKYISDVMAGEAFRAGLLPAQPPKLERQDANPISEDAVDDSMSEAGSHASTPSKAKKVSNAAKKALKQAQRDFYNQKVGMLQSPGLGHGDRLVFGEDVTKDAVKMELRASKSKGTTIGGTFTIDMAGQSYALTMYDVKGQPGLLKVDVSAEAAGVKPPRGINVAERLYEEADEFHLSKLKSIHISYAQGVFYARSSNEFPDFIGRLLTDFLIRQVRVSLLDEDEQLEDIISTWNPKVSYEMQELTMS